MCLIYLGINQTYLPQLWVIRDSFESQTIKEYCKCNTLEDYTKNNDDDSFYQFIYYADPESFSNYLSHFKKIIGTVEFDSEKES